MQRKEVSLEEAIKHLNLVSEETADGVRLYWGPESDKNGQAVTVEEAETEKASTQTTWKVVKASLSNSSNLRDFYANTFRSWTAVSENLAKLPKEATPEVTVAENPKNTTWETINNSLPKNTSSAMTLAEATELLELDLVYTDSVAEIIDADGEEVTLEVVNRAINDSELTLESASNSEMIGGHQYWHKRNIEAWTVIRDLLEVKES